MGRKTAQEADPLYRALCRVAPEQCLTRRRKRGYESPRLFCLHQRRRQEVGLLSPCMWAHPLHRFAIGLLPLCGEKNCRSIPYAANIRARLAGGCILLHSRPPATSWLLQVSHPHPTFRVANVRTRRPRQHHQHRVSWRTGYLYDSFQLAPLRLAHMDSRRFHRRRRPRLPAHAFQRRSIWLAGRRLAR